MPQIMHHYYNHAAQLSPYIHPDVETLEAVTHER